MKKVGTVPTIKTGGAGSIGKSPPKTTSTIPSAKLPTVSSTPSRSYASSSYNPAKSKSTTFGIIWLPGKKRNKHKESVYNSHKNERPTDRAPSMYNFMSSESSSHPTFLKKSEEESNMLVPERSGHVPVAIMGAGAAAASELPSDIVINTNSEESQELIKGDKDGKDGAGDTNNGNKNPDTDCLQSNNRDQKSSDIKSKQEKMGDNTDSVFLRSPPPHKTRSTASTVDEEDCGIKCLYYTLQCCDCVLM